MHRIELQETEREMLEQFIRPQVVKGYAYSAGAAVLCVGVGLAGYSAFWWLKKAAQWGEDAKDLWDITFGKIDEAVEVAAEGGAPFTALGPFNSFYRWVGGLVS